MADVMSYRGYLQGRVVDIERMNSYIKSYFDLSSAHEEQKTLPFSVSECTDPWQDLITLQHQVKDFFANHIVQLGLQTLDYIPIIEIDGASADQYTDAQLAARHDARMERQLIDAMAPDWGDLSWYTTPASVHAKQHVKKQCIGVVVRTPYARSQRQTVGKNELYNLHMLASRFEYTSIIYLSFEPLTSYSTRVIEQKHVDTHIEFFPIERSQCNIMRHVMVPYYRMLTEEAIRTLEERHSIKREFFPRISKTDPVVKWMQYPPHSVVLEVPHFGTGYDASRFCYVLAVKDTDDEGEDEPEGAD